MSFPVFKDFDKDPADLISDDFDSKVTLKVKAKGPVGSTITTNTSLVSKDNKQSLLPKLSLKWPHPSGFTLEKLEFSPDFKITVETSLANVAPGLKVEFKGNDSDKADLSVKYSAPLGTVTGDFDIHNFAKAETSVCTGNGPLAGGAKVKFTNAKDESGSKLKVAVEAGLSHTVPGVCFSALRAKDNFTSFGFLGSYTHLPDADIALSVDYSSKATSATLASAYKVDPTTILKAKATTDGVLCTSIKKSFDPKFSVVGSVEVPVSMKTFKWGLNMTLG